MSSAQERIREAVVAIQAWLAPATIPGEAVVRQAIVLRLLHAAGFDIWNPAEVVPEETNATGNRSDFLIRAGQGKFALELKGMNVTLGAAHYQQVTTYAANEGTRWAMLTNGRVWVVLDRMHNPGGTFLDHEVLKLELGQERHTFADDLAALLDVVTWQVDAFAEAVQTIRDRQQQRLNEERVRREKTDVVNEVMAQFRIPTFELAVAAAAEMNKLTEAERDVLLRQASSPIPTQPAFGSRRRRNRTLAPVELPLSTKLVSTENVRFTYRTKGAEAHAIYDPRARTWMVLAGSTALNRVLGDGSNARGIRKRRQGMQSIGHVVEIGPLLRYTQDVTYGSPSAAAMDIFGSSKNGWTAWKDDQGRPAQHYRPAKN